MALLEHGREGGAALIRRPPMSTGDPVGEGGRAALIPRQATPTDDAVTISVVRGDPRWQPRYVRACLAVDVSAALLAAIATYLARWGWGLQPTYLVVVVGLPMAWALVVAANRGYERRFLGAGSEEFRRISRSGVALAAGFTFFSYLFRYELARGFVLGVLPAVTLLTLVGRYALRRRLHALRRRNRCMHRVVVVGHAQPVLELLERLGDETYHGLQVVGACLSEPHEQGLSLLNGRVPVVHGYDAAVRAVRLTGADTVAVMASEDLGPEQLRRLAWELEPTGAELLVAPALVEVAGPRLSIRPVSGLPLLHVEQPSFSGGRRLLKSTFDRAAAVAALALLSPLLLGIALAVRIESRGSVIFRQERVGKDSRRFILYKFRTMVENAEQRRDDLLEHSDRDGPMFKMRHDPRVTRVGAWLRRYSLDELPQLLNVACGQMSLVGPRPPLPHEVDQYAEHVRRRLLVPPGVTGLWQVSGRADLSWEESVRLDLRYVDNWSFALDMMILWKTGRAVLGGAGAY